MHTELYVLPVQYRILTFQWRRRNLHVNCLRNTQPAFIHLPNPELHAGSAVAIGMLKCGTGQEEHIAQCAFSKTSSCGNHYAHIRCFGFYLCFLLVIVLSVLLWFTDSDYLFGIFKLFFKWYKAFLYRHLDQQYKIRHFVMKKRFFRMKLHKLFAFLLTSIHFYVKIQKK
jgi:hypothetical protein